MTPTSDYLAGAEAMREAAAPMSMAAADAIIDELTDRKSFRHLIDNLEGDVLAEIKEALAAIVLKAAFPLPTPVPDGGWRSMDSAPRDGTWVMLWWPEWHHTAIPGYWLFDHWDADRALSPLETPPPRAWMPLPPPPGNLNPEGST